MNEDKGTIEITVCERDNRGYLTGRKLTKECNSGEAAERFYNGLRGHSVDREFNEYHNGISIIQHSQEKKKK